MNLRPMTMADADKMLEWKNYPETRMYAIASSDEIKKEDHYVWLEKNIQYFHIIELSEPIGAIRIQDNEVSIWIEREQWSKGIAESVLNTLRVGMTAKIVCGNIASLRAFIRAGYEPVEFHTEPKNYYTFKKQ